jgi:cell division protein FtsI/penicillin-binding protein 2
MILRIALLAAVACLVLDLGGTAAAVTKKSGTPRSRKTSARKAPRIDPTDGDNVDGDDLAVRRAAVQALGGLMGSVVAVDPDNGRILTIVNQKLALQSGFIPCSTVKLVTALAALNEHLIERNTFIYLGRYSSFNLTSALAKSNNPYFAILGNRLGFEKVTYYARLLGLGEKAGLDIPGEQPGLIAAAPPPGGVGLMCSFGEGFSLTPLELSALLSAIANGGTLYYLQYPRTQAEIDNYQPRIKRELDMKSSINDIKIGMRGAVDFGTARRAGYDGAEPILGKTGTCTDYRSSNHMGWFGSFNEVGMHKMVVVVMLIGGHSVNGPVASGVAGSLYRQLDEQKYWTSLLPVKAKSNLPEIISTSPTCCAQ